jgi:hypothetical protein
MIMLLVEKLLNDGRSSLLEKYSQKDLSEPPSPFHLDYTKRGNSSDASSEFEGLSKFKPKLKALSAQN